MRALGEMAVAEPVSGSFSFYANRYLGPFAGYLTGWTYWFMWVVVGMAEITVAGVYVNYWFPEIPQWVTALVALVIITMINLVNVKTFGEFEFWFALIKVVAIIGMILGGLGIILFGFGNDGQPIGFDNLWAPRWIYAKWYKRDFNVPGDGHVFIWRGGIGRDYRRRGERSKKINTFCD